ncbi:hypothetical protein [Yersinia alsatica]|uniref:Lipoprotein n=1 Tax=Yersinia alsatica TaxID=2890317 RepID=A0ABY5UJH5_9GAMM|nr:hypothetical protein [Yersinia alsatica]OWF67088.1 hypothetical protein B4901_21100 [Yersinia frederiksenii]UWM43628.1 hypothetical protein N0H69_12920 [Yersinia alsatica]
MLKKSIFLLFAMVIVLAGCSDPEPTGTKVFGGKAYIDMPAEFTLMSKEMLATKYPQANAPQEAYAVGDGSVSFAFSDTNNAIPEGKLGDVVKMMKTQFAAFKPTLEEKDIDGRKAYILTMDTPAADGTIKNVMLLTTIDGKLAIATFNSTEALADKYMTVGNNSLLSLKFKK